MSPSISEELLPIATSCVKDDLDTNVAGLFPEKSMQETNSTEAMISYSAAENNLLETSNLQPNRVRSRRTLESFSLEGKVCVVTGGASGIGLEICRAILASGGQVAIMDLNGALAEQQAKALATEYRNLYSEEPPLLTTHPTDVSSPSSISLALSSIIGSHGRIDTVVTSAGICENHSATTYPYARMQKLWSINVDGTYLVATAVARHLLARDAPGSMVFIGSMSGSVVNVPQLQTPYNVSKAAVKHMARSLAVEWAGEGIRVNCVSPGYVGTALTEEIMRKDPELGRDWVGRTPMGRLGRPGDIVGAVVFLLSDASGFVTGSEVLIDGGYTAI